MQFEKYSHNYWMNEAVNFAKQVKDEVPVCALIVKDNTLISKAVNRVECLHDPTAHAEILAIREASQKTNNWRLNDYILYTTLEPCSMCCGAIINSRISKVIFGAYDLQAGAGGSALNLIHELSKEEHVEIIGGIMELEASGLLKSFFETKR